MTEKRKTIGQPSTINVSAPYLAQLVLEIHSLRKTLLNNGKSMLYDGVYDLVNNDDGEWCRVQKSYADWGEHDDSNYIWGGLAAIRKYSPEDTRSDEEIIAEVHREVLNDQGLALDDETL